MRRKQKEIIEEVSKGLTRRMPISTCSIVETWLKIYAALYTPLTSGGRGIPRSSRPAGPTQQTLSQNKQTKKCVCTTQLVEFLPIRREALFSHDSVVLIFCHSLIPGIGAGKIRNSRSFPIFSSKIQTRTPFPGWCYFTLFSTSLP